MFNNFIFLFNKVTNFKNFITMKKFLFLLGGIVTLTACSEDILQDIDETTEDPGVKYTTNSYTGSGAYKSPWNIDSLRLVGYNFDSNVVNWDGVYVRITPYIGLAYYDGANDGVYNTPTGAFNLAGGAYPNLFPNGEEYGNYIEANPIVLASQMLTGVGGWYTHELFIQSREDHCPLINIPVGYNYNLYAIGFDVVNNSIIQPAAHIGATITPPPPAATPSEEMLLQHYGKVFYYKVEYGLDPYTFNDDVYYTLALEADTETDIGEWDIVPEFLINTSILKDRPFDADLKYHLVSREIVVDKRIFSDNNPSSHILHDTWFATSTGDRKIQCFATGYPLYYPPGSSTLYPVPGAEPRSVAMYFH